MDLVRFTIRTLNGESLTRFATTAQDVDAIEARYLETIKGAIDALRTTTEKNISRHRAAWLYQAQSIDWYCATFTRCRASSPAKTAGTIQ